MSHHERTSIHWCICGLLISLASFGSAQEQPADALPPIDKAGEASKSTVATGDNANVQVGIRGISAPCGLEAGDRIEFGVSAREMSAASQISLLFSWQPPSAVSKTFGELGSGPREAGLLAPFDPLIFGDQAEYGMAGFTGASLEGETELATFGFQLAPHIQPETPIEIWVDELSLGPSLNERDVIRPLQAVVLANYCDGFGLPLRHLLLLSPEQATTEFSPDQSAQTVDGSAGEILLKARLLGDGSFAPLHDFSWSIENEGETPLYLLANGTTLQIDPTEFVQVTGISRLKRRCLSPARRQHGR